MNKIFQKLILIAFNISIVIACSSAPHSPSSNSVDTDANRSWAEAVAISNGRIIFVGSNEEANKHLGDETIVVDLHDRMMLPA